MALCQAAPRLCAAYGHLLVKALASIPWSQLYLPFHRTLLLYLVQRYQPPKPTEKLPALESEDQNQLKKLSAIFYVVTEELSLLYQQFWE